MLIEYLKVYFQRLKNTSHYKIFINNCFLIVLFITLFLLTINYWLWLVLLVIYGIYIWKNSKIIFIVALVIIAIISVELLVYHFTYEFNSEDIIEGRVLELEKKEKYQKITIIHGLSKTIVMDKNFTDLKIGYYIKCSGTKLAVDTNHNENEFDYQEYLYYDKVINYLKAENIKIVYKSFSLFRIHDYVFDYLDQNFSQTTKVFLEALLFASSKGLDDNLSDSIKNNGISHLFAVSGLHISLFLSIFASIYNKLKVKENHQIFINTIFLSIYLFITYFTPSILRVSISYLISVINKKKNLKLSSLDVQSISFIILIIINPLFMKKLGFILSFIASFSILLTSRYFQKKTNIEQILGLSVVTMIFSLPVVSNINNEINLLTPILNIIFILLVTYIILPASIITFIIPYLSFIYKHMINAFSSLSIFISKYINLSIVVASFSGFTILMYYFLIFLLCYRHNVKKMKYTILSVIFVLLFMLTSTNGFYLGNEINFLDLYNGESTVIINNGRVVVIDTGDGTDEAVTRFLKSKGITRVDGLILTHNHYDHNGEADRIIKEFNVTKIYVSEYDDSEYSLYKKCIRVKSEDIINIGGLKFRVIGPIRNHIDANDDSIILEFNLCSTKFLMLGDLTKTGEKEIISMLKETDVIKIGHHGSNTSTSLELLNTVKPQYAIIQTGRLDKFNFPHASVVALLKQNNIRVYQTNLHYAIKYKYQRFSYLKRSI